MKKLIKTIAATVLSLVPGSANPPIEDSDPVDGSVKSRGVESSKEPKSEASRDKINVKKEEESKPDFVLPTRAEMAKIIDELGIDVEKTEVMFGYKSDSEHITFYNDQGDDVLCAAMVAMNTNDDQMVIGNAEESVPGFRVESNPEFIDGGWTNGMSFGCVTNFGDNEFNAVFKHDMYTAQTRFETGDEVINQRPAGGEFSLSIGQKENIYGSENFAIDNYWETKLGYREINLTEAIQDGVHSFYGVPERDYETDPLDTGWSIDASVGISAQLKYNLDNFNINSGPFFGVTEGDYKGDIAGYKLSFGTGSGEYDTGIPFKTDTTSLFYGGTGLSREGDWELEITTGIRNIRDDSRFRDDQLKENTQFTNINMIRQISDNVFIITGIGFSDNPSKEGSDKVNSYSIGIGFTPGKKPKKVRRDEDTQQENKPYEYEEEQPRIPFRKNTKDRGGGGFER